jgi:hypothetical protein
MDYNSIIDVYLCFDANHQLTRSSTRLMGPLIGGEASSFRITVDASRNPAGDVAFLSIIARIGCLYGVAAAIIGR